MEEEGFPNVQQSRGCFCFGLVALPWVFGAIKTEISSTKGTGITLDWQHPQ